MSIHHGFKVCQEFLLYNNFIQIKKEKIMYQSVRASHILVDTKEQAENLLYHASGKYP